MASRKHRPVRASAPVEAPPKPKVPIRLPDGTRSAQSPWVWRGMFMMSLVALGLCITFLSGGSDLFAGAWGVIFLGWFAISMWLWRKHLKYLNLTD